MSFPNIVGGPGNDVFFGNTVRASIALLAYQTSTRNTLSLGNSAVNVDNLSTVGGVRTIVTSNAPVVTITGLLSGAHNLALSVPNPSAPGYGTPIVCFTIINASLVNYFLHVSPPLSRVANSDLTNTLEAGYAHTFYYSFTDAVWYQTKPLLAPIPP